MAGKKPPVARKKPPGKPAREERTRLAWLANKKQELLDPANAILELSDMLIKDAREVEHSTFLKDLEEIQASAQEFLNRVHEILDLCRSGQEHEDLGRRIRHELRSPLTCVLGLCEIWLEDAEEFFLDAFLADIDKVLTLGKKLLGSLDDLVRFSQLAAKTEAGLVALDREPLYTALLPTLLDDEEAFPAAEAGAILVVDDSDINRDLLYRRLTRQGHAVTLAENGRNALELLAQRTFDLILLDIIMPEMNGLQVLERLKNDESWRHIPVIMISAFREIDSVARCIEMGAEDYLPKPFNPVVLRARVNASLEKKRLRDREVRYLEQIAREKQRADELLHVILPTEIVQELKATNAVLPRRYENVAVLFCDLVGFTPFCDHNPAEEVVRCLQNLIETWEEIALAHRVEKIKTIGDAFMAAAGLLQKTSGNPVLHCVRSGQEMIAATQRLGPAWDLRVGIHYGPVVAGVIGRRKYLFDLWGDTVNTAARMESHGTSGSITLSSAAWSQIAHCCRGQSRGIVSVKGKGDMEVFRFVDFLDAPADTQIVASVAHLPS